MNAKKEGKNNKIETESNTGIYVNNFSVIVITMFHCHRDKVRKTNVMNGQYFHMQHEMNI